ncbi:MAG: hypothetical protein H6945_13475 [Zoogloeaceae bacterium]|nr:hypothetical protein [Rhodocyclaceae bacterium]MCP5236737.1 hypothetical protein [Zoogloeaceae bacterium]
MSNIDSSELFSEPSDFDPQELPCRAALAFILGDTSEDNLVELRADLLRWARQDDLALHRVLGLPPSPCSVRRELRDFYLREAAALLQLEPEASGWARSVALYEAACAFELRTWESWADFDRAPSRASPLQRLLWKARKWAKFPDCDRQFHNLRLK